MTHELLKILLHTPFWAGLAAFAGISVLVALLAKRTLLHLDAQTLPIWNYRLAYWGTQRLALPLGRAFGVVTFLFLAYPEIYGVDAGTVPTVRTVLSAGPHRSSDLLNILFFSSLGVSLIPVLGRFPALVLPVQGIAGATLLFHWMNAALDEKQHIVISYWPGAGAVGTLVLVVLAAHWIAVRVVAWIEDRADASETQPQLIGLLIGEWMLALFSLVPVLTYTVFLGRQLRAALSA